MSDKEKTVFDNMASYLCKRSKEICHLNGCDENNHNCESNAYFKVFVSKNAPDIIISYILLDICSPDFFPGLSRIFNPNSNVVAISLPFEGDGLELEKQLIEELQIMESL